MRGDAYAVVIKVNDDAVDYLQIQKIGDTLHIGFKPGSYRNVKIRATVALPDLTCVIRKDASVAAEAKAVFSILPMKFLHKEQGS